MEWNYTLGHFLLSQNFENFYLTDDEKYNKYDLKVSDFNKTGSLFLNILNYYDKIIDVLEKCKGENKYNVVDAPDYIEKELSKYDKTLAGLLSKEVLYYFRTVCGLYITWTRELKDIQTSIKYEDNNDMLNLYKEREAIIQEKLSQVDDRQQLLINYIDDMRAYLSTYKTCCDLYFGTCDNKEFKGKDISVFQSVFTLDTTIPKQEVDRAIIKNNKLVLASSLFFPAFDKAQKITDSRNATSKLYEVLKEDLKDFNKDNSFALYNFEISSIKDILAIYYNHLSSNNITINKCKNCDKYFIPANRTDEKYCDNPSPEKPNKTCKEYGVKKMYSESVASDPIKNEHYRTSQFYRVRISRAQKKGNTKFADKMTTLLLKYQTNYERMLAKYNKNKLSESDFVTWIIDQKKD